MVNQLSRRRWSSGAAGAGFVIVGLLVAFWAANPGDGARGAPPTEAAVPVFDQCANGQPPSVATDCPEGWINGILPSSNSHYAEDESVPQRLVLELPEAA